LRNLLCLPCRHPLSTVVVLAALGLPAFFGGRYLWADHHLRLAERALDGLDLAGAEAHLRRCLRIWPADGRVHVLLAQIARRTQNYEEAEHELEICAQIGVRTEQAELERLLLRVQRGDLGGTDYDLYQRSEPDSPESMLILEALAQGYLSTFHIHGAMRCLERMLERQPDNTRALFLKGQVMENTNRFGEAMNAYRRILALDPENFEARLSLGDVLLLKNQPQDALEHFEYLAQRQPDDPTVRWGLACSRNRAGLHDQARPLLDALVRAYPDKPRILAERGKLALDDGQLAEAEAWLRESVRLSPHDSQVMYALYLCLERRGSKSEAQHYYQRMEELDRDQKRLLDMIKEAVVKKRAPELRCQIGRLSLRLGMTSQGLRWLEGALLEDPQYLPALEALADYYEKSGQPEVAARYRRRATDLKPGG